ncbi:MAG: threonine synthase, partial [Clostridiales bacterium]|nr:threonine synthase [Clostridiales bacterium]
EAFSNVPHGRPIIFYSAKEVRPLQLEQMNSRFQSNMHAVSVDGSFREVSNHILSLLKDQELLTFMEKSNYALTTSNSLNFAHLLPQIVNYFASYFLLLSQGGIGWGDPVHFVIPTGSFSNILAGFYARNMGLPIDKLICASNRNNALTDFFATGTYSTHRLFFDTLSPSLNTMIPDNLERLLYDITDRDGELVKQWMELLTRSGSFSIGEQRMEWLSNLFVSGSANDRQTQEEIRFVLDRNKYLMDPHTAVASHVLRDYRETTNDPTPAVILSTASPYKFPEEMLKALQVVFPSSSTLHEKFQLLASVSGVAIPEQLSLTNSLPPTLTKPGLPIRDMKSTLMQLLRR